MASDVLVIADVALMEKAAAECDTTLAGAGLGCRMRLTHAIVVRERQQDGRPEQKWFCSLGQVADQQC